MLYSFQEESLNRKTGPIPTTYAHRETCPPSCGQYRTSCYAEDIYTRMAWGKVSLDLDALCDRISALPDATLWRYGIAGDLPGEGEKIDAYALGRIVQANRGKRGFAFSHKHSPNAIRWIRHAVAWGFTINLSADDAGHADVLAETGLPVACLVPMDTPERSTTPAGRPIRVCPAQTRDTTCKDCQLCSRPNRKVIVGFRAHGTRARRADGLARRVIPIVQA